MPLQYYHFSVDDVLDSLIEASLVSPSLFQQPFFRFLGELHEHFDAVIDLYLFLQQTSTPEKMTLADISDSVAGELKACKWLRLGPHARDDRTPPHAQSPDELKSVLETLFRHIASLTIRENISRWVRLHYFSESYEQAPCFRSHGVQALLTTDKPATSYRLPAAQTERLRIAGQVEFGGLTFIRSNVRVENLVDRGLDDESQLFEELDRLCLAGDCAVIFTHEYELAREDVRQMARRVFSWIVKRELRPAPAAIRCAGGSL